MTSAQERGMQYFSQNNYGIFPSKNIDWFFISGIPLVAIISGLFVSAYEEYFLLVLMLDLWLLGYHHVISTYTRIGFDAKSIKEHWLLLLPLPIVVFGSVASVYHFGGAIVLGSLYLYWQWYHYTRQSEGISKSYAAKYIDKNFPHSRFNRFLFYLVPLTSFGYMVSAGPTEFLGIPIFTLHLDEEFRLILLGITLLATGIWLISGTKAFLKKHISFFYYFYMLSHFAIYLIAYTYISEINYCWLTINIWHNAQYIGFVWLFNRKKFASGVSKQHLVVSYISQPNRVFIYLGSCLVASIGIYWLVDSVISIFGGADKLALVFIVYSAINFHHYIVDSQIWKLRKPHIEKTITQ